MQKKRAINYFSSQKLLQEGNKDIIGYESKGADYVLDIYMAHGNTKLIH